MPSTQESSDPETNVREPVIADEYGKIIELHKFYLEIGTKAAAGSLTVIGAILAYVSENQLSEGRMPLALTTLGTQYKGTREFMLVYSLLIEAARRGGRVYYREVAPLIGVPPAGHHMARQVGQVLGEISEAEHEAGRPMLSAIAVSEAGVPGDGFFKLARRLGVLSKDTSQAEQEFLKTQQELVYQTWG